MSSPEQLPARKRRLLPAWPLRTWILIGVGAFVLISVIAAWGWWNSWTIPEWRSAKYEYLNGPTVLKEVRGIGQLVGSEYYGEVVHSWLEQQEAGDWVLLTELYNEVQLVYRRHYKAAESLPIRRGQGQIRSDAINRFVQRVNTLSQPQWYRQVLVKAVGAEQEVLEEIRTTDWETFANRHRAALLSARREFRQEYRDDPVLIYLGRGDVLIGYDLTQLTDEQLKDPTGDTLVLENLDPIIISAAINPWYLPPDQDDNGKGIPGFESLRQSGEVSNNMVERVKTGCKRELVREAFQNGAAELAEQSAEQTLLRFYNLLVPPERMISAVDIQPSKRYQSLRRWSQDNRIDAAELKEIREMVQADSLSGEWLPELKSLVGGWGNAPGWEFL